MNIKNNKKNFSFDFQCQKKHDVIDNFWFVPANYICAL